MTAISNMYICICNNINETDLREIIKEHEIVSMPELQQHGVCDNCSSCFESALDVLKDCVDEKFKDKEWYISPNEGCHWELEV